MSHEWEAVASFFFGKVLPSYPVYCAVWPGLQMKGLGHVQSLASPHELRRGPALWDLASFCGEAWSHEVTELPQEHTMTFVIVGLCTERSD